VVSRRPGYLFSHDLWLDEGWVADSVRAPLGQIRMMTSSTPLGWTWLLRLVPHIGPPERLRVLPLAFGVAAVAAAWLLGRALGRPQAVVAALAAALAPSSLANHNLKQYSADVFVTLLLLALAARLEARWSPGRLAVLCLICVPALLVSHAAVLVSMAVLLALAAKALLTRDRLRLAWTVGLGAMTALVEGAAYLLLAAPGDNSAMRAVWAPLFVPLGGGPGHAAAFVATRFELALRQVGFGPPLLAAALVCAGVAVLWRARLQATAAAVPLLAAVLVTAAAAGRYPLLDQRTSLFFTSLLTVVGALAVGQAAAWAWRRPATLALGLAAIAGAGALLVPAARSAAAEASPATSIGKQVRYVLDHRQPGDAIVVGWAARSRSRTTGPSSQGSRRRPTAAPSCSRSTRPRGATWCSRAVGGTRRWPTGRSVRGPQEPPPTVSGSCWPRPATAARTGRGRSPPPGTPAPAWSASRLALRSCWCSAARAHPPEPTAAPPEPSAPAAWHADAARASRMPA
jgi:hypothetical protein